VLGSTLGTALEIRPETGLDKEHVIQLCISVGIKLCSKLGTELGKELDKELGSRLGIELDKELGSRLEIELDKELGVEQLSTVVNIKLGSKLETVLVRGFCTVDIKLPCAKVRAVRKNIVNSFDAEIGAVLEFKLGSILGMSLGTELGIALGSEL
jgi:hypothetical protein